MLPTESGSMVGMEYESKGHLPHPTLSLFLCINQDPLEKENKWRERGIYPKEWAHGVWRLTSPVLCWESRQAGGPGETKRQRTPEELTFQCTSEAGGKEPTFQLDSGSQVGRILFHVREGQPLRSI